MINIYGPLGFPQERRCRHGAHDKVNNVTIGRAEITHDAAALFVQAIADFRDAKIALLVIGRDKML